ncbi:hypothetical protein, partial [Vibrio atlanticus]|uniref:hypothetical protein n=1 Tax=Vibrio atlanticus TaxID=693153 RepID=UPI00354ED8FB
WHSAKCRLAEREWIPYIKLDLLLIHILFMGFCPTRSYPFFSILLAVNSLDVIRGESLVSEKLIRIELIPYTAPVSITLGCI